MTYELELIDGGVWVTVDSESVVYVTPNDTLADGALVTLLDGSEMTVVDDAEVTSLILLHGKQPKPEVPRG